MDKECRFSVRIPEELHRKVKALAKGERVSMRIVVERLLKDWVKMVEGKDDR